MSRDSYRPGRAITGAALAIAVLCAGGAAFATVADSGEQNDQPGIFEPASYVDVRSGTGEGLSSTEAVARVLDGLASTAVKGIKVVSPPSDHGPSSASWVVVRVADIDPEDVEAGWLGSLAQGAVADLMRHAEATTQDVISGGNVVGLDAAGHRVSDSLGSGYIAGGQKFDSPSDDQLSERIHGVADAYGLEVRELTILHPLDSAVSVSFTVPDSAVSWTIDGLRAAIDADPKSLDGTLIRLYSTSGDLLLTSGVAYRTGAGALSFAPGQDQRFGALHGGLPQS